MLTTGLNIDLNQYKDKITELLQDSKKRFFLTNLRRTSKSSSRHSH